MFRFCWNTMALCNFQLRLALDLEAFLKSYGIFSDEKNNFICIYIYFTVMQNARIAHVHT